MKSEFSIEHAGRQVELPAIVKISFAPVIESLRKLSKDEDKTVAAFANKVLDEISAYPILEEGFTDHTLLKKYEKQISQILRVLFPDLLLTNEIKGVTPPFQFHPFYLSTRFSNILKNAGDDYVLSVMNFSDDEVYIFVCCVILAGYYGYYVDLNTPFKLTIPDQAQGLDRVYRVAFNADMIKVFSTERSIPITQEDYAMLIENFTNIDLWKSKFPPGSYILSGIGLANLMDVTVDQSFAGITANLVSKSNHSLDEISDHLRSIFRNKKLRVGYMNYEHNVFAYTPDKNTGSILLNSVSEMPCETALCHESYDQLIEKKEPLVFPDLERANAQSGCTMTETLLKQGVASYIVIPLVFEGDFLGFIELASENKYELSVASVRKLSEILPVISMALSNFKKESRNEMDAVIQQKFTRIHSSVKWRFEEEARKYINQKKIGGSAVLRDLDFPEIYPLFGQLDIKGSSTTRNEVIRKDINTQLTAIRNIFARAIFRKPMPLYEELVFQIDQYLADISYGLQAGSEHDLIRFLRKDVYPVFLHLKSTDKVLSTMIKKYEEQLDPQTNLVYDERKKFDESITRINKVLSDYLDKKQLEAQDIFPHYFERYKSDGIEYNMYIGASIAKGHSFSNIYVHNLRIWQLMVMSELENEYFKIKGDVKEPLEIASLIMVHSDPLSIQFRVDEKKFDIKGAYNARYEIIKKRIDKAYVKGTEERITVPGKLVIVYSNDQDAIEYTRYINFLSTKGYFKKSSLERLVLEDLQGITGLQALRVEINYEVNEKKAGSISELLVSFENS
jgi:hypothetical protein